VLPREAREGPAPPSGGSTPGVSEAVLVGWKPDEIYSKSHKTEDPYFDPRVRAHFRVGLEHELNLN
jgi:hypothetical protein